MEKGLPSVMSRYYISRLILLLVGTAGFLQEANSQNVLTLKDAIQTALNNYGTIKAKANYINASKATVKLSEREYLPDVSVSFQQDYGTVNGTTGPLYGYKGLSTASSGPALSSQNWNAAFGALYLTNVNWDFYSFGKAKEKIKVSQALLQTDVSDLEQEKFQHEVRVAAAYLNLLAAQRIVKSQQDNLARASNLRDVVVARVKTGLNAGVDSSLSNAEVSNARLSLTRSIDYAQEQANQLAQLMGVQPVDFTLDTVFITRIPASLYDSAAVKHEAHPLLKFYHDRIATSDEQAKYFKTFNYPTFSLFGVLQSRGTGFDNTYGAANTSAFTHNYWDGVNPLRTNYLFGVGMIWNLTTPLRVKQQVDAQKLRSRAMMDEYEVIDQRLHDQEVLSDSKIKNAVSNYLEAPVQLKSASDAYLQKTVMYKNGLSNIVDVTQTLYTLNRAQTDRDIAYSNVWQALLLRAAATGDFGLFINQF